MLHTSPYEPINIPEVDILTLISPAPPDPSLTPRRLLTNGERPSRSYTLAQLRTAATEFGKDLKALWGWKRGDVLTVYGVLQPLREDEGAPQGGPCVLGVQLCDDGLPEGGPRGGCLTHCNVAGYLFAKWGAGWVSHEARTVGQDNTGDWLLGVLPF